MYFRVQCKEREKERERERERERELIIVSAVDVLTTFYHKVFRVAPRPSLGEFDPSRKNWINAQLEVVWTLDSVGY